MNNFVVYAYCRKDGTFYYIGKGRPDRPYSKRKKGINPPKDLGRILILHQNLSENTAFSYETGLILFYGRKDIGTGLLRNKTNGGEGVSGWIPDEEWRRKKSEDMKGEGNPMFGVSLPPETLKKASEKRMENYTPEKNFFFGVRLTGERNPMYGKSRPDVSERNRENSPVKGTKWYNNGKEDRRFHPDEVPEGYVPKRLKVVRGHKRPDLSERNRKRGLQDS